MSAFQNPKKSGWINLIVSSMKGPSERETLTHYTIRMPFDANVTVEITHKTGISTESRFVVDNFLQTLLEKCLDYGQTPAKARNQLTSKPSILSWKDSIFGLSRRMRSSS